MTTLEIGQYTIPEGCVAKIKDGVLTVRKSRKITVTELRCKNCKYFGIGHAVRGCRWYNTRICLKKPKSKPDTDGGMLYFTANSYDKPCKQFEKKEE